MTTDRKDSSQVPWVLWYLQPKQANNEITGAAEQNSGTVQVLVTTHSKAAFQEGALEMVAAVVLELFSFWQSSKKVFMLLTLSNPYSCSLKWCWHWHWYRAWTPWCWAIRCWQCRAFDVPDSSLGDEDTYGDQPGPDCDVCLWRRRNCRELQEEGLLVILIVCDLYLSFGALWPNPVCHQMRGLSV